MDSCFLHVTLLPNVLGTQEHVSGLISASRVFPRGAMGQTPVGSKQDGQQQEIGFLLLTG